MHGTKPGVVTTGGFPSKLWPFRGYPERADRRVWSIGDASQNQYVYATVKQSLTSVSHLYVQGSIGDSLMPTNNFRPDPKYSIGFEGDCGRDPDTTRLDIARIHHRPRYV